MVSIGRLVLLVVLRFRAELLEKRLRRISRKRSKISAKQMRLTAKYDVMKERLVGVPCGRDVVRLGGIQSTLK